MARIRSIKPDFPQSESMGRVSRDARLTFILLWTIADDEGRLRGNSRMLASLLYPYDTDAPKQFDKWMGELEKEKCVVRYCIDGNNYVEIRNWLRHQKIDKPSKSRIPPCENIREGSPNGRECSSGDGIGREGIGEEGKGVDEEPPAGREKFIPPTVEEVRAYCLERANGIDAEKFVASYTSKGWMVGRSKMKDWKAAVITWEKNTNEFSNSKPGASHVGPGQRYRG